MRPSWLQYQVNIEVIFQAFQRFIGVFRNICLKLLGSSLHQDEQKFISTKCKSFTSYRPRWKFLPSKVYQLMAIILLFYIV